MPAKGASARIVLAVALVLFFSGSSGVGAKDYLIGGLKISNAWSRVPPHGSQVAGGFLTITNLGPDDDTLVAGDASVSGSLEVHETYRDGGVSQVRRLTPGLVLRSGETIVLAPDALHLLFVDLLRPIRHGQTFKVTLQFARAGTIDVEFVVEPQGARVPSDAAGQARAIEEATRRRQLLDQDARPFDFNHLVGSPYVIFFGYSSCPDVCPTALLEMSNRLESLGDPAERLRVVFVSVDHERDTPAQLKSYLGSFHPRIVGLSGTAEAVEEVAEIFGIYYKRHSATSEHEAMYDHTAGVFLFTAEGDLAGIITVNDDEQKQLEKLRSLLRLQR